MKKKVNLFAENHDMQFVLDNCVEWDTIIPLLEHDFAPEFESPYSSVEEALEFYKEVLNLVGEIGGTSIAPRAKEIDKEGNKYENGTVVYHPGSQETLKELTEAGLFCLSNSRVYGGQNISAIVTMLATELLSNADGSVMTLFALADGVAETIERFGDEETKLAIIPKIQSGEYQGSMVLTEDNAGSDLGGICTRGYQKDGQWYVSGTKKFITNAPAKVSLVLVRTDDSALGTTKGLSLFMCLVDERVEIISLEDKLGIKGSPTCMMNYKDAPAVLLGELNNGFRHMLTLMNMARLGVAAQACGIAQASLTKAIEYAQERKQFGGPINQQPMIQEMLTQMTVSVEAMRALVVRTAAISDLERGYREKLHTMAKDDPKYKEFSKKQDSALKMLYLMTPLTKYWCTEQAVTVVSQAMQVFGGNGYTKDYDIERYYRDVRVTPIYEGTTEIQVLFGMRSLTRAGELAEYFDEIEAFCEAHDKEGATEDASDASDSDEFVYSVDSGDSDADAAQELSIYGKLRECKSLLLDAGQILLGTFMDTKSDAYLRLKAREISELGIIVAISYEFAKQGLKSPRKAKIAQRFINDNYSRAKVLHKRIESVDLSIINDFEDIVHGQS